MISHQSNFTINEFKKALHEYTEVLSQAKMHQSLKNYHSRYRKFLNEKVIKIQEKRCIQINNAIPSSLLTLHDFDIYPLLFSLRSNKLLLKLPTTYYYNHDLKFMVKSTENLEFTSGPEAFLDFFNDFEDSHYCSQNSKSFSNTHKSNDKTDYPVCIFKTFDGKIRFFDSKGSAKEFMDANKNQYGLYQAFVKPSKGKPAVLMHHLKKGLASKLYVLQNKILGENNKNQFYRSNSVKTKTLNPNQSRIELGFGCQLENTYLESDSLYFPVVDCSIIEPHNINCPELPKNCTSLIKRLRYLENPTASSSTTEEELNDKYVIDPRNTKSLTLYMVKMPIPEIESMSQSLILHLSRDFKQRLNKEVDEFQVLYIKDKDKGWLLLKVKAVKCSEILESHGSKGGLSESDKSSISSNKSQRHIRTSSDIRICKKANLRDVKGHKLDDEKTHEGFLSFERSAVFSKFIEKNVILPTQMIKTDKNVLKKRISVRNIGEIKASNSFQKLQNKSSIMYTKGHIKQIDDCVQSYEKLSFKAKMQSKNFCGPSEKYAPMCFWKEFSFKVNEEILQSPLRRYFKGFTRKNIKKFSRAILRIFCLDIDLQFKKEIEESHKGLKITEGDYTLYRNIFIKNLKDFGIEECDLKMIMISFDSMKDCVVDDCISIKNDH
ncbi:hypothetical protein SteCoe_161 [Stentor coeruleus]|uniref:Uncharacterized protein n=1 Tax=Stentor coeruleus TaxID=5963 RepID=A0A1R2D4N2_9CILI|nr:hypothetical protein SteCoe_161 [Stentor coeruleus]